MVQWEAAMKRDGNDSALAGKNHKSGRGASTDHDLYFIRSQTRVGISLAIDFGVETMNVVKHGHKF
jgi:hypothetical protein